MRKLLSRRRPSVLVVVIGLLLSLGPGRVAWAQSGPTTWTVLAGKFDRGVSVNLFGPAVVRIHVGDTVRWSQDPGEPHTVSFLAGEPQPTDFAPLPDGRLAFNPKVALPTTEGPPPPYDGSTFLGSGLINDGFSVSFSKAGTFDYVCLIHPGMNGQVIVEEAGSTLPSQAELDQQAAAVLNPLLDTGRGMVAAQDKPSSRAGANGTSEWHVKMGADMPSVDINAFLGGNITVAAGDTVVFDYTSHPPHNALFPGGGPAPELILPEPQPAGPPNLLVNPTVLAPSQPSGGSYSGSGLLNSGLFTAPQIGASYAATFTTPGTYSYLCSVHGTVDASGNFQGMVATIKVVAPASPVSAPVSLPNTGADDGALAGTLGAAAALIALGLVLRRRRAAR